MILPFALIAAMADDALPDLVAVRYEENDNGGAFGQHSTSHAIEVVRLQP